MTGNVAHAMSKVETWSRRRQRSTAVTTKTTAGTARSAAVGTCGMYQGWIWSIHHENDFADSLPTQLAPFWIIELELRKNPTRFPGPAISASSTFTTTIGSTLLQRKRQITRSSSIAG